MQTSVIAPLANISFPSSCRLLPSACCPDKDLVVLISRLGAFDRLSLWKIQGGKKWEVDVCAADSTSSQVIDVFWSPDGMLCHFFLISYTFARSKHCRRA